MLGTLRFRLTALFLAVVLVFGLVSIALAVRLFQDVTHEQSLRELRRVLRPHGSLLVTVPLGEPGDHGWFRQEDEHGWMELYARADFFVRELEAYELGDDGWRAAPAFRSEGVRYGERGPAASAVLCAELSPGRLRHLLTPGGLKATARRRARPFRHGRTAS